MAKRSCRTCQGYGYVTSPAPPYEGMTCPTCEGSGKEPKAPRSTGDEHLPEVRG